MCLLKIPTVLHMFFLVRAFIKTTLKTSLNIALRLRRFYNSDKKFEIHSAEYQN